MDYRHVEFWQVMIASSFRYFVFAGITYLVFYVWRRKNWLHYKIQQKSPTSKAVNAELKYSMITLFIFTVVIYSLLFTSIRNNTRLYTDIHEYSVLYFFISLAGVVLLHDTYFYWTHRLMHWKKLFPFVHHIHHHSHNPTPLAAFSFHPLEALIEIGILPLIAFTFPVHRGVIAAFSLYMIVMNVIGHLGFELYPSWFLKNSVTRWLTTSTHHNMHHHYGKGNYGLYFNIWDRLLKTNHPQYEMEFAKVIAGRDKEPSVANG
ncbi:MAG: sterol desaturase [Azospira oryzae]|jgi:lathosterol oxidase|nr:MAG: sterol desaturase [Azospira oryzae]